MPFYLKESDVRAEVDELGSLLIVPCRFCPAASLAVRERKPYLRPFRNLMRTKPFESFILELKRRFEDRGVRTEVFDSKLLHHFVVCLWTARRRRKLARRAAAFDGVLVLGCEGAVQTVRDALGPSECRIIRGMEVESLMNAVPRVTFPFDVSLDVRGMTPVQM